VLGIFLVASLTQQQRLVQPMLARFSQKYFFESKNKKMECCLLQHSISTA
jgi:hypothetical protein